MNPQTWLPIAIIAVAMVFRLRRVGRASPVRVGRMWLVPALYAVAVIGMLVWRPPSALGWLAFFGALAVGAALGWYRGRLTNIDRHPETGELMMSQSRAAVLLLFGVIVLRQVARGSLGALGDADPAQVLLVTDAMLGLAFGLLSVMRLEWALRVRRLQRTAG